MSEIPKPWEASALEEGEFKHQVLKTLILGQSPEWYDPAVKEFVDALRRDEHEGYALERGEGLNFSIVPRVSPPEEV